MRICSFLPAATEILYALDLGDSVAGVTYECDFPPEAREKPVVVHTRLPHTSSPAEIDRSVREFVARSESLYQVDMEVLKRIEPDLIFTQDLCHVCAASPGDLASALAALPRAPRVVSLSPTRLSDVWQDIRLVGEITGRASQAAAVVAELQRRVLAVERSVANAPRPRVLCLEWLDPPFVAGHWVPEMVACAGGIHALGRIGEPGFRVAWEPVLRSEADVLVLMPCGYGLVETLREFAMMQLPEGWEELPAARHGRIFAVDASSYFSRPGPRLATGAEILAYLFHSDRVDISLPVGSVATCPYTGPFHREMESKH